MSIKKLLKRHGIEESELGLSQVKNNIGLYKDSSKKNKKSITELNIIFKYLNHKFNE